MRLWSLQELYSSSRGYETESNRSKAERLFERFFTVQTAKESTGIGLSIAKVLTEKMDGNIDAAYSAGYLSIQVMFQEK